MRHSASTPQSTCTESVVHLFQSVFMLGALTQAGGAVDDCAGTSLWGLSDDDLLASLDATHVLAQRLATVQLGLVREVDAATWRSPRAPRPPPSGCESG